MNSARRIDDSAAKGLWVLLVAVGHVEPFWRIDERPFAWLYQFHVASFLLLPFLRDEGPLTPARWLDRVIRYYVPLLPVAALTFGLFGLLPGASDPAARAVDLGLGLVFGHASWWDAACGFQYLWFLPTLLGLTALRQLVGRLPRRWRWLAGAGAAVVLPVVRPWAMWLPLGLATALWALPWGLLAGWLSARLTTGGRDRRLWALAPALAAGAALTWLHKPVNIAVLMGPLADDLPLWLLSGTSACGMFLATLGALPWLSRSRLLVRLGEASLPFYLTHSLTLQVVLLAAKRWLPSWSDSVAGLACVGVAALGFALCTALPASLWILRTPALHRWWLPRGRTDWPPTAP